jgi:NAD/NADP transhydrogenase beta subunit
VTVTVPDFSALQPVQFLIILVIVALVDFATAVLGAIRDKTFAWDQLVVIAQSHGVNRILPIGGLFAVGVVSATASLCYLADALLAAYVVETLISVNGNISRPAPTPPAP